jgi:hypothetical protein
LEVKCTFICRVLLGVKYNSYKKLFSLRQSVEEWRTMSPCVHAVVACRYVCALALSLWKTIVGLGNGKRLFLLQIFPTFFPFIWKQRIVSNEMPTNKVLIIDYKQPGSMHVLAWAAR